MSSHSCLAKEFQWGCVEFILKANTPKLLFLRSTGEFCPIDWWSHDKSMCEVLTFLGVCVDNVVRVYGWSLGKGQNILAKGLKMGGIMQNSGPKFCVHFAHFEDHISP